MARTSNLGNKSIAVHIVPGVDARAAALDFLRTGAVGIDDIGESVWDVVHEEIFDELGHAADAVDVKAQRVETAFGPVFVLRDASRWTAASVRKALQAGRGGAPRKAGA